MDGWMDADVKNQKQPAIDRLCVCVLAAQSCLTPCNPVDCSPAGPSVHGTLQARTLEWVDVSFSKRNYRKKQTDRLYYYIFTYVFTYYISRQNSPGGKWGKGKGRKKGGNKEGRGREKEGGGKG